jgi:histidinol-phosphatase
MSVREKVGGALIGQFEADALEFAHAAGITISEAFKNGFEVHRKADASYVTSADLRVERQLRQLIQARHPAHGIIGEEFPRHLPEAEFQWILDPIDGTEDFVHRVPTFGSIVALYYRGAPLVSVLDHPLLGLRCHAAFGRGSYTNNTRIELDDCPDEPDERLRVVLSARANFTRYRDEGARFDALARAFPNHRIYRSCYGHSLVASGAVDVMVDFQDTLWDLAAARLLTEEAGGRYHTVADFFVNDTRVYSAVFGRPSAVARLVAVLEAA